MKLLNTLYKGLFILVFFFSSHTLLAESHSGRNEVIDTAHFYMKHSYDVLRYQLNLDLFNCYSTPPSRSFIAKEVITIKADSSLPFLRLNAVNTSLGVDSVGLAGVSFLHLSDTLTIQLSRTFQPGETTDVAIYYHHKNVSDNAFYAAGGYVFTDTPPEGARKWFPCWDRPSDKALFDITAKVPATVRLGSVGTLADSLVVSDTAWYHWVSRDPIATYLVTISSKINFLLDIVYIHVPGHPYDSIPARFYYKYPEIPLSMEQLIGPMTTFYSEKFGGYPFEKIGFASLNSYFPWGGMENQTMINLRSNGWQEGLISHEFSHQWFGDLITCGTWADVWLNESFATYCESVWIEHQSGDSAYRVHLNQQADYYLGTNPGLPIYNPSYALHTPDPNTLYNTELVYYKGACVLHQLRYLIGDSLFFRALHTYATDTSFMYKNAVTQDFVQTVNQVTGQDLTWFFREWIYFPDHPKYSSTFNFQDAGNGTWNVNFLIRQTQENTTFFRMPVTIQVRFKDQTDTLIRVLNESNDQLFEFSFGKEPETVLFDPNRDILLKQATTVEGMFEAGKSTGFQLMQNVPNPFRTSTRIGYHIVKPSPVTISVFDSSGNLVYTPVNKFHDAGNFSFEMQAGNLSPGFYFYKLESGKFNITRKMILEK